MGSNPIEFLKKNGGKIEARSAASRWKTPHIQAICSVEEVKIHKYKNQKGEFLKENAL